MEIISLVCLAFSLPEHQVDKQRHITSREYNEIEYNSSIENGKESKLNEKPEDNGE